MYFKPLIRVYSFLTFTFVALTLHAQSPADWPAPRVMDAAQAQAAGIRAITGRHLRLWTDVPSSPAVDELPGVFDAAVSIWAKYFGVSPDRLQDWQVQGFLIRDRAKFAALDLLPKDHHDFLNGYALGNELWLEEQPSDYYRRHLLLHEGTHSFMLSFLGSAGPGWYMEGMAELLGTHRWQEAQLELRVLPADKEDVPMWGRIKLIREAVAAGQTRSLGQVLSISNREALSVDAYAWCWALTKFLDSHPQYGEKFPKLAAQVSAPDFNERFRKLYHQEWKNLEFAWQAFLAALDYGYDPERMTIESPRAAAMNEPIEFKLETNRGWQATPGLLKKGQEYKVTAVGKYVIADDGEPWPCEPNGVTLRYHDGQPLGVLLGSLRLKSQPSTFTQPVAIGLGTSLIPEDDAILYLRVNDSPAELSENQGVIDVRIVPVSGGD